MAKLQNKSHKTIKELNQYVEIMENCIKSIELNYKVLEDNLKSVLHKCNDDSKDVVNKDKHNDLNVNKTSWCEK